MSRPLPALASFLVSFLVSLLPAAAIAQSFAEAFEVGKDRTDDLLRGKEADGIIGDFVLRNDKIEALVGGNLHQRRPNFTVHGDAPTPGCLYDLSVRGSNNDQLTCLQPGNLRGEISSVHVAQPRSTSEQEPVVVVAIRTAASGDGLEQTHAYLLRPGADHLEITSTYVNQSRKGLTVLPEPNVVGLRSGQNAHTIAFYDAQDPMDRQGYAYVVLGESGGKKTKDGVVLAPGGRYQYSIAVAPGHSPAHAFSKVLQRLAPSSEVGSRRGRVVEGETNQPATTATLRFLVDSKKKGELTVETWLRAYPLDDGSVDLALPAGSYRYVVEDLGRTRQEGSVDIQAGQSLSRNFEMDGASTVAFKIRDAADASRSLPCKVQFFGVGDTRDPDLGVPIRAHGCNHQYHSETGDFEVAIPPGEYRVLVTRGIEYDHHDTNIAVAPGKQARVEARLQRVVDTTGWVSTDFHNHATESGDNYCGVDDRVINLAAEQVEYAPTTEHNRIYDWYPHIKKLGLENELATSPGIELTGPGPHLNSFPLTPVPHTQDNGAPSWVNDPRINAIVLRDHQGGGSSRWVQINHPDIGQIFRDRNKDGTPDGGFAGLARLIDAIETLNYADMRASSDETRQLSTEILVTTPYVRFVDQSGAEAFSPNRSFRWMQLLNQGLPIAVVSVADAHTVFDMGVGGWRTYIPSSTDNPAEIDVREIVRNAKAGRMVLSNGPFLEVTGEDGAIAGDTTRGSDIYRLDVRVQSNTWVKVDRVVVLANGRLRHDLDFRADSHPSLFKGQGAERFRHRIPVSLAEDSHLIVVAVSEDSDLRTGYGKAWQGGMRPCAYNNPIFVDVDGNGFTPNGDTLGHPLPVGPLNPPKSK